MRISTHSKKAYEGFKKSKPGPSLIYLQKEQSDIFVQEGFIEAMKPFLIHMTEQEGWTFLDSLCTLSFDEIKLQLLAMFDSKTQSVVGPNAFGLLVTVRGLIKNWSYPIFTKFDYAPTKEDLINIVKWLHDIKFTCVLSTCDQGINFVHGLAKEYGFRVAI